MINSLPISTRLPLDVGLIHFVGIGGIGMSGIAEVLHNLGYKVQGSDSSDSYNTQRLKKLGITVHVGHNGEHIKGVSVVVKSSAIKADNPEMQAARQARLPIVRRAEMLAELMRLKMSIAIAGTHGKTTTTALTAAILEGAELQPTVINGGIINARGTNAYLGKGEWMVVEADESDGSFTRLPATIAVVTNMDPEHLDHYGSYDAMKEGFRTFVSNIPFYGFAVMCIDHPEVQALSATITDRRIVSYGTNPQAAVRARNIRPHEKGQLFDVEVSLREGEKRTIRDVLLPMFGQHNVSNALAAIAVGCELKITDGQVRAALEKFEGVKRRFTRTGEAMGMTIIDDYAHHPVEIAAALKAARAAQKPSGGGVIAVVQPHRYTRLRDLFKDFCTCFNDADTVIVAEVYPAGEEPITGIDAAHLVEGLRSMGHRNVLRLEKEEALSSLIASAGKPGDMVICLGAGSITKWAYALAGNVSDAQKKAVS
ncbi:MAG: UDP-N-acetylmuramate--L-alanine ligase [Alphaproteobacteria bacterium]